MLLFSQYLIKNFQIFCGSSLTHRKYFQQISLNLEHIEIYAAVHKFLLNSSEATSSCPDLLGCLLCCLRLGNHVKYVLKTCRRIEINHSTCDWGRFFSKNKISCLSKKVIFVKTSAAVPYLFFINLYACITLPINKIQTPDVKI
jgi:hypothetical protein